MNNGGCETLSFWDGLFIEAMLVLGRVYSSTNSTVWLFTLYFALCLKMRDTMKSTSAAKLKPASIVICCAQKNQP